MGRIIATHLLALYLGAGLFGGLLMQRAIPAMNGVGVAFYAATWPRQIACARVSAGCRDFDEWMPGWMVAALFTFD